MLKSHEKFHSSNGKRLILVADDEAANREILGFVLADDYEVLYACDGKETLEKVREHKQDISLLLLDLMMPVLSGIEVLKTMKADPELQRIPVVVLTADKDAEVESLTLGAADYIPKPYPKPEIVHARILKAIELSEDRDIIQSTERDALTGLYNREFFYRYAEQYDQHHWDREMDAIVVDINHFHMINERFGTAYGDEILKSIGQKIRECVADSDGIVCRREADTFMAYFPHGMDYKAILENASVVLTEGESFNNRVRLRMGVYSNVDKSLELVRRFDRAKLAADTVRNSYSNAIAIYDNAFHEREIYAEQLIDDFPRAIAEKQFKVYYQPKFDVRPKKPVLSSAEALVRWQHPDLGMISPGVFIPLFEENGLVQKLDKYVWEETAAQICKWREEVGFCVPVSVNVSRIDMYDPELRNNFKALLEKNGLSTNDLLLEITESAYTEDSSQIVDTVKMLRNMKFKIEMDDFGTGYSSLNMISALPIDALKLDMQFVRSAFKEQKDTRMLEVIIDIADHLSVPVIAEGVETEEQMLALRELGCDIIQGYYFSKPVPSSEFVPFLEERKLLTEADLIPENPKPTKKKEPVEKPKKPRREYVFQLRSINFIFVALILVLAFALGFSDLMISRSQNRMDEAVKNHLLAVESADGLESGSDYLTVNVRSFAVIGDLKYLNDYFEEVNVTKRRDKALDDLNTLLKNTESSAYKSLEKALQTSNDLMGLEYHAMRLTQLANGYDDAEVPAEVSSFEVPDEDLQLTGEEMKDKAVDLLFGDEYMSFKEEIRSHVAECTDELIEDTNRTSVETREGLERIMHIHFILLIALVAAVLLEVLFITLQIRVPLLRMLEMMRKREKADPEGAAEIRSVAKAYNEILEKDDNGSAQEER